MTKAGVPVVPGYHGNDQSTDRYHYFYIILLHNYTFFYINYLPSFSSANRGHTDTCCIEHASYYKAINISQTCSRAMSRAH